MTLTVCITMSSEPDRISVVKYDAVTRLLSEEPQLSHPQIAKQCGVAASTVERIWNGTIARPPVVVIERLAQPRRCPGCGALCKEWPCILCEMGRRRRSDGSAKAPRFQYRNQTK